MRINDMEELRDLSEKLKVRCGDFPVSLKDGLMGSALFFYFIHREVGDDAYLEFADDLLVRISDGLNGNLLFDFENGLPGVGWGIEYLVQNGFVLGDTNVVLHDFDVLFRRKLSIGECTLAEVAGISLYFTERNKSEKRRFADCIEEKRLRHNMLLCLNKLDERLRVNDVQEVSHLLQCLVALIDFYQLNMRQFRVARLLERLLLLLKECKSEMSKTQQLLIVSMLDELFATHHYFDDSLLNSLREAHTVFISIVGLNDRRGIPDQLPCIFTFEGQIYLLTECRDWILLFSGSLLLPIVR